MTEPDPKPQLDIKSDADWKQQVKQEAAQFDAQRKSEQPAATRPAADAGSPPPGTGTSPESGSTQLPPADFTMLVSMFTTQAMVSLGLIPNPETGRPERNRPLAKHFIDLLGVLQEKTRRNLTGHESDLLENSLHELRMAFVELSKAPPADSTTSDPPSAS